MIESIQFKNFKVLRDAKLPLGRCTVLVGPNGSGKTTVLEALELVRASPPNSLAGFRTVGLRKSEGPIASVTLNWEAPKGAVQYIVEEKERSSVRKELVVSKEAEPDVVQHAKRDLREIRTFSFDAPAIAAPSAVTGELGRDGSGLAGLLFQLRDAHLESFESITDEFGRCIPEFDRIQFASAGTDTKVIVLRTREGHHRIHAGDLSQGTLWLIA